MTPSAPIPTNKNASASMPPPAPKAAAASRRRGGRKSAVQQQQEIAAAEYEEGGALQICFFLCIPTRLCFVFFCTLCFEFEVLGTRC